MTEKKPPDLSTDSGKRKFVRFYREKAKKVTFLYLKIHKKWVYAIAICYVFRYNKRVIKWFKAKCTKACKPLIAAQNILV